MALCYKLECRAVVNGGYEEYTCLEHASCSSMKGTCALCNRRRYILDFDATCNRCRQTQKQKELLGIVEKADFLDELDCPREVLIDLVCRWNNEQDCDRLNLPDTE